MSVARLPKAERLARVFKIGTVTLADPDPNLPPEEVIAVYSHAYPMLRNANLREPELSEDGCQLVYEVERPRVQTKGVSTDG